MKSDDETGSAFGSGEPFSVGVEEAKGSVKNAVDRAADKLTGRNRSNKRT